MVTVVDMDSNEDEKLLVTSLGSATGLNLRDTERIYFGGLPTIGNYRYRRGESQTESHSESHKEYRETHSDSH